MVKFFILTVNAIDTWRLDKLPAWEVSGRFFRAEGLLSPEYNIWKPDGLLWRFKAKALLWDIVAIRQKGCINNIDQRFGCNAETNRAVRMNWPVCCFKRMNPELMLLIQEYIESCFEGKQLRYGKPFMRWLRRIAIKPQQRLNRCWGERILQRLLRFCQWVWRYRFGHCGGNRCWTLGLNRNPQLLPPIYPQGHHHRCEHH